jgi:NNP family nitrate/nitrite transporter-like MFS transporter
VGGGNFASSMSNISTFFPKRLQGTALGINAGVGNFGVTTMQIRCRTRSDPRSGTPAHPGL